MAANRSVETDAYHIGLIEPWLPIASPLLDMPKSPHARSTYLLAWDGQRLLFWRLPRHLAEMALFKVNAGTRESEVCALQWSWE